MAINNKLDYIARLLLEDVTIKDDDYGVVVKNDKATFEKYRKGDYTLDECIYYFKKNNRISMDTDISRDDMREWLKEQGYR